MATDSDENKPAKNGDPAGTGEKQVAMKGPRRSMSREAANEVQQRQRAIGAELRKMFDEVTREPVPQEFLDLLEQIDRKRDDKLDG